MAFKGASHYFRTNQGKLNPRVLKKWFGTALRTRQRYESARRSKIGLSTLCWGQKFLTSYFRKAPSRMHEWLGEQLDTFHLDRGMKLNVIGPRGGAKSTIGALAYELRAAVERWEPYIWVVSDTRTQALKHLNNIREELESNDALRGAYPEASLEVKGTGGNRLKLTNGAVIEAYGTGQRLRGRREGANRPTLIVCDDLQNDSHMRSAQQRESSRSWFHGTLMKAGDKRTNVMNLATALHREALAMELHDTPGWKSAKFQAIEVWPARMDLWQTWEEIYSDVSSESAAARAREFFEQHRETMELGAELLWPAEEDLYTLMKMRVEGGRTAFEREKQNSPHDAERCEWPEEYFSEHIWFDEWPNNLQFKTIALDPSKGRDAGHGDYSAFVVLGVDRKGVLFVEADLQRRDIAKIIHDGVMLVQRHRAAAFGVEANQFQELLADEFVKEFSRQGIFWCVPSAIHNYANKILRIRRLGPYLSRRRVRFLRKSSSTLLLVNQLRDFPSAAHDDGPDALEMALRLAEELFQGGSRDDGLGKKLVGSQ